MLQGKEYFFNLLIWILPASIVGWCLFQFVIPQHAFVAYYTIPVIMLAMGGAFYYVLRRVWDQSIKNSFKWFMLNTAFKMMVSVVFVVVFLSNNKESLVSFGLTYLVFYLLLIMFETTWFMKIGK